MDFEDELRSQIKDISGGTDFIVTMRSDGQLFATGKNAQGQLGLNHFNAEDGFRCIEDLTDKSIYKIFAGSRSCFAVAKSNSAT